MASTDRLNLALEAVRAACVVTRAVQDEVLRAGGALTKADRSPVTVADFAAQAVVGRRLGQRFVGEETVAALEADGRMRGRVLAAARSVDPDLGEGALLDAIRQGEAEPSRAGFWTLDPVDGTKGFIRGAQYCVSLAWVEDGAARIGVLGCPRLGPAGVDGGGVLLWAAEGEGARQSGLEPGAPSTPVRARAWSVGLPVRLAESAESAHTDHSLGPTLLRRAGLPAEPPLRLDSQVKYAVVARGDADVFLRRPKAGYREKIWDHAGGTRVAAEAGCAVSDFDGGPLRFGAGRELEPHRGILVAPPDLHARLLEAFEADD